MFLNFYKKNTKNVFTSVAYITCDKLWAKPKPTFELRAGFHQACLMFARCLLDRVNGL